MSNYINVLRRLERERRAPEALPVAPAPVMPAETTMQTVSAPAVVPAAPPTTEPAPSAPAPVARTVIPLPSAVPPAPTTPVVAPAAPAPVVPPVLVETPATRVAMPATRTAAPAARIEPTAAPIPLVAPGQPVDTRRARAFAPHAHPGIATLLENIRMLSGQRAGRIVVLCGASTAEPVAPLAAQLVAHAEAGGMRAMVGTLLRTATGSVLMPGSGDDAASMRVDLDAGVVPDELNAWAQRIAPASDLVVLTGPPLASSIDAALLACACDGLVIVAESEVTDRTALQTAAERARIAGCRTLGVVMHGTKDRLPGWIRRIVGEPSETSARED
jgi:hypothetical protein